MPNEQEATLAGLQTALQMEIDGKEFYLKSSKASQNSLGKDLLKRLAGEEDIHRKVFQKIYDKIKSNKGWPDVTYSGDGGQNLRTVFAKAIASMKRNVNTMPAEIDAVKTAMDMENKTLDYYNSRKQIAVYDAEKQLYDSLASQEHEHHRVLMDYYDFLKDPAQWYVKAEHTSVDGG